MKKLLMKKKLPFRAWFYFRQGWTTYFAFIFAAVNTMVTTYYLAIENIPALKSIFPSFLIYVSIVAGIGIPILVLVGYIHYKKSSAYSAEADINVESYPYFYKLPPGWNQEVVFPLYSIVTKLLVKIANNEKLTEEEIEEIKSIEKKIDLLICGGYVGSHREKKDDLIEK
jgi:hypothetical protein